MKILVTNIQKFSVHDGPGIRTTVFFKGCPLDCVWCHNPETKQFKNQLLYIENLCIGCGLCVDACKNEAHVFAPAHVWNASKCNRCMECVKVCPAKAVEAAGKNMTAEEIITEVMKDKAFYSGHGGITLSGGEPLMHIEACVEILKLAKAENIHTAIETSGFFDMQYIDELIPWIDLFLWDYKDTSLARHIDNTGVSNEKILNNLVRLDQYKTKIILRCIMVKGINMDAENVDGIIKTYHRLKHCIGVELLQYHVYGGSKNQQLGLLDNGNTDWIPDHNSLLSVKRKLIENHVHLIDDTEDIGLNCAVVKNVDHFHHRPT